jgi:hypothetical protein
MDEFFQIGGIISRSEADEPFHTPKYIFKWRISLEGAILANFA